VRRHLLIFDIDGTLVDSERMILSAQGAAFAALGLAPPTRERGLSIVGLSLNEAFRELAGADGPVEALAEAYRQAFFRLRTEGAIPEPLYDGAANLIETCSARPGMVLGIATGKSRRGVGAILDRHGWQDRFATIQTADDAPSKPHPAMILQATAEAQVSPEKAIMIGDSTFDMAMARAAGARAIGVAWGFQPRDALVSAGAEAIAADFDELDALIRAIVA
jgi:phosphoglycolate phosphatase